MEWKVGKGRDLYNSQDGNDEIIALRHTDFIIISMNIIVFSKRFQAEIARGDALNNGVLQTMPSLAR